MISNSPSLHPSKPHARAITSTKCDRPLRVPSLTTPQEMAQNSVCVRQETDCSDSAGQTVATATKTVIEQRLRVSHETRRPVERHQKASSEGCPFSLATISL